MLYQWGYSLRASMLLPTLNTVFTVELLIAVSFYVSNFCILYWLERLLADSHFQMSFCPNFCQIFLASLSDLVQCYYNYKTFCVDIHATVEWFLMDLSVSMRAISAFLDCMSVGITVLRIRSMKISLKMTEYKRKRGWRLKIAKIELSTVWLTVYSNFSES